MHAVSGNPRHHYLLASSLAMCYGGRHIFPFRMPLSTPSATPKGSHGVGDATDLSMDFSRPADLVLRCVPLELVDIQGVDVHGMKLDRKTKVRPGSGQRVHRPW